MIKRTASYILLLSLLFVSNCFVDKEKSSCMDFSKQEKLLKSALEYLVNSKDYRRIFSDGNIEPFIVNPTYAYFSFDCVPLTLKDSIIKVGRVKKTEKITSKINNCFFEEKTIYY